ncbi:hypothetical protein GCM10027062_43860 [Nocardioides hungaricus]
MSGALVVHECAGLGAHRRAWDALVLAQPLPSPFARSWWLDAHPARYLLVLDEDRLVGGLALSRTRRLGMVRYAAPGPAVLCPDHLDLLAEPGREDAVAAAVGRWFATRRSWLLDVRGLVAEPLLARAVGATARPDDVAPWRPLPAGGESRSVRRSRRRLAERGLAHRVEADVGAGLGALRRLHEERGDRGPLLAELDVVTRAVAAGAARGEARVDVLADGPRVAAVVVSFLVGGRLSLYQVARSLRPEHDGAGTVLLADVVASSDAAEVDLLRGDEAYKRSFADHTRTLTRLRVARGPWPRLVLALEDAARAARRGLSARRRSQAGSGA